MRRILVTGSLLLVGGVVLLSWSTSPTGKATPPAKSVTREAPAGTAAVTPTSSPRPPAPTPESAVRTYLARQTFHEQVQQFLKGASTHDAAARDREAQAISQGIDSYEARNEMSAGEALLLRVALIRATVPDEAEQIDRVAALSAAYRARAAQQMAEWESQSDRTLEAYKVRERAIVEEAMARQDWPAGVDRDTWLRERLQREREIVYGAAEQPSH
ncbi:hypothetical protein [Tahibacter amnicola]|uniref:Lipase chaperone n=1 Tax=Tahibacter amnicola TaxID=2976241 RepID=A0ABY6BE10_9GAMM|nr:hypothetical protein [Tahibacter amnicola]UXI68027.1 hypothetical protein N4264_25430 [Tahibacter amnicola]